MYANFCLSFTIDRFIEDYMSEKVAYVVTLEGWDANFDQVYIHVYIVILHVGSLNQFVRLFICCICTCTYAWPGYEASTAV